MRYLKKLLKDKISEEDLSKIYSSFDLVGDIAIIKVPKDLENKKEILAKTLLDNLKNVKVVLRQTSPIRGEFRLRDLEYLAGEYRFSTFYKEYNCIFKVDLSKVYFSPRLSHERIRISNLVKENETILNMFGGIGTFSIIIAKHKKVNKVYNVDLNPYCYELALENVKLNKLEGIVIPILGDVREVIEEKLKGLADRVLMPYPAEAKNFFSYALEGLKDEGGIIHYYSEVKAKDKGEALKMGEKEVYELLGKVKRGEILNKKILREVGPRVYHLVFDLSIIK